jgi:hypothetical protein
MIKTFFKKIFSAFFINYFLLKIETHFAIVFHKISYDFEKNFFVFDIFSLFFSFKSQITFFHFSVLDNHTAPATAPAIITPVTNLSTFDNLDSFLFFFLKNIIF